MRSTLLACAVGAFVATAGLVATADAAPTPQPANFSAFCSAFNSYTGSTQGAAGGNNCGTQVKSGSPDNGNRAGQAFNYPYGRADAEGMYAGNDDAATLKSITGNSSLVQLARDNNGGSDVTTYGTLTVTVSQSASNESTFRAQAGSWSFTSNGKPVDPLYLVVKGGNGFTVWALSALSTKWSTEGLIVGEKNNFPNWSHVSIYGSLSQVPVPAALPLLATALGGLGFAARRRRTAAAA